MREQFKGLSRPDDDIPRNNLAHGIAHGPYQAMPEEMVVHYAIMRHTSKLRPRPCEAQFYTDMESEWYYDQNADAVAAATDAGRITENHELYMLDTVLRPWFIMSRNPDTL